MEILDLETEDRNGLVHVALKGELDLSTVAKVQDELRRVEESAPPVMVLDLSRLTFLDSTGLGVLVGGLKRVRAHEGSLRLVCTQERILKIFRITGLTKVFPIHASVAEAVAATD